MKPTIRTNEWLAEEMISAQKTIQPMFKKKLYINVLKSKIKMLQRKVITFLTIVIHQNFINNLGMALLNSWCHHKWIN